MQACVLPVWLCCLSLLLLLQKFSLMPDLLFGAWSSHIIFPLSVFASTHVFVRSVFMSTLLVSTLLACVVSVDPAVLACVTSPSLCLSSVSLPTLLVRTLCFYVNSLCLCPLSLSALSVTFYPLYVLVTRSVFAHPLVVHQSLPTLLLSFCSLGCPLLLSFCSLGCPFCLAVLFMSLLCLCFCCPLSD